MSETKFRTHTELQAKLDNHTSQYFGEGGKRNNKNYLTGNDYGVMNCLKCRVTPQDNGHQTCGHVVKHGAGSLPVVWGSLDKAFRLHSEKLQARACPHVTTRMKFGIGYLNCKQSAPSSFGQNSATITDTLHAHVIGFVRPSLAQLS
jgi:hypothetical protein